MKIGRTIVLLVLLIALGAYVYFVEIKHQKTVEKKKEFAQKLFHFKKDSVKSITIKNQYGKFVLENRADSWKIVAPVETEADKNNVRTMLNNLETAKKNNEFSVKPNELGEYGLGEKALNVWIETNSGERDSVHFGDKTPVGGFVFANKVDTLVFTVNEYIRNQFDKKLYDLRDKHLLTFTVNDVKKVRVKNPHGLFEFEKIGADQWEITSIKRLADEGKVRKILNKLNWEQAKAFVDEEGKQLKKYGLVKPAYYVELDLGPDKGMKKLLISRKINGKYYAHDVSRKPIFEIDKPLVEAMDLTLNDFRSTRIVRFVRDNLDSVYLEYGSTRLSFTKDKINKRWLYADTARIPLKDGKMNSFFSNLEFTLAKEFVKDGNINYARYGLDKPVLRVKLFKEGKLQVEMKFGKQKGNRVYAWSNQNDSVYLVDKKDVDRLKLKLDDILKKPKPVTKEKPIPAKKVS